MIEEDFFSIKDSDIIGVVERLLACCAVIKRQAPDYGGV